MRCYLTVCIHLGRVHGFVHEARLFVAVTSSLSRCGGIHHLLETSLLASIVLVVLTPTGLQHVWASVASANVVVSLILGGENDERVEGQWFQSETENSAMSLPCVNCNRKTLTSARLLFRAILRRSTVDKLTPEVSLAGERGMGEILAARF